MLGHEERRHEREHADKKGHEVELRLDHLQIPRALLQSERFTRRLAVLPHVDAETEDDKCGGKREEKRRDTGENVVYEIDTTNVNNCVKA